MNGADLIRRFLFDKGAVRGEIVHLRSTWEAVLERHDYPPALRSIMGQFMAASALLAATLKFSGSMIMQVQSQGAINLLVVECTSDHIMRGTAQWSVIAEDANFSDLLGNGQLIITIDPLHSKERYQGIVELQGNSVAEALEEYLQRSEQLDTHLWLAADETIAAGMLLQKLPDEQSDDEDLWPRAIQLASTLSQDELLQLNNVDIVHRLFHQEDIRLFDPQPVQFGCSCSRERVGNVLKMLGHDEVSTILKEEGMITVDCEFCNQHYEFDKVDTEQLFVSNVINRESKTRH